MLFFAVLAGAALAASTGAPPPLAAQFANLRRRFEPQRRVVASASGRIVCGGGSSPVALRNFVDDAVVVALRQLALPLAAVAFSAGRTAEAQTGSARGRVAEVAALSTAAVAALAPEARHAVAALLSRVARRAGVPSTHIELQLNKYAAGGHYSPHFDTRPRDANPRDGTLLLYLDTAVEGGGGETVFPLLRVAARPTRGTAVMWSNVAGAPIGQRLAAGEGGGVAAAAPAEAAEAAEASAAADRGGRTRCVLPPTARSCRDLASEFFDADALDAALRDGTELCSWHAAMPLAPGATKVVLNAWIHRFPFRRGGEGGLGEVGARRAGATGTGRSSHDGL
jgi:hypothetical protein